MDFLKRLEQNAEKYPDGKALSASSGSGFTYGELDAHSGRVYAYLAERGIGREDFVMICLPRGCEAVVAMLGVWKAGAAFCLMESTRAPERIAYIRKDIACRMVIDEACFEDMMRAPSLPGFVRADPHDACMAIYTSGSTGNPKGILHEYGKLGQMIASSDATMADCPDGDETRFALVTPMDFAASITEIVPRLYRRHSVFIVPGDTVKNPARLEEYLESNRITDIAMTPSLYKTLKRVPPCVRMILSTGEGLSGIYSPSVRIINKYAMSESMFTVATFLVDRPYNVTPSGKAALPGNEIVILSEADERLSAGMTGEVCFQNDFWRGYMNLQEATERARRGGLFRSGDMGYLDENGNLLVIGRRDDMMKINGNRIEPAEIEAAVKEVMGISTAVARGFQEKNRSYIALYYLKGEAEKRFLSADRDALREALLKRLPSYMIPTYYVGLDEIPLNANGKLNRRLLPAPDIRLWREEYVAPRTESEIILCETMARTLGVSRFGATDDFFEMGGDSLRAIELIGAMGETALTVGDIYRLRTPAKLAKAFEAAVYQTDALSARNRMALGREYPLTQEQIEIVDAQFYEAGLSMWNIPCFYRLGDDVDAERFARAADRVIAHHPSLNTRIRADEDGRFVQYYDPNGMEPTPIIETTEAELSEIRKHFVQPFRMMRSRLIKTAIYRTEAHAYFFMDIHHLVVDGFSGSILNRQIYEAYSDENASIPEDFYYLLLDGYFAFRRTDAYAQTRRAFEAEFLSRYPQDTWRCELKQDRLTPRKERGLMSFSPGVKKSREHGNVFFIAALARAVARFNGTNRAFFRWLYHDRDEALKSDTVGMLYNHLPVAVEVGESDSPVEFLARVRREVDFGMSHNLFSFEEAYPDLLADSPIFLYQKDVASLGALRELVAENIDVWNVTASNNTFALDVIDNADSEDFRGLVLYSASNYSRSSVERFVELFREAIRFLDGGGAENSKA